MRVHMCECEQTNMLKARFCIIGSGVDDPISNFQQVYMRFTFALGKALDLAFLFTRCCYEGIVGQIGFFSLGKENNLEAVLLLKMAYVSHPFSGGVEGGKYTYEYILKF